MRRESKPRLRLDDKACEHAAHLIADAAPSLVPDVIERDETDPRVKSHLRQWLAQQPRKDEG